MFTTPVRTPRATEKAKPRDSGRDVEPSQARNHRVSHSTFGTCAWDLTRESPYHPLTKAITVNSDESQMRLAALEMIIAIPTLLDLTRGDRHFLAGYCLEGGGGGPYEEWRFSVLSLCIENELEWYGLLGA